MYWNNEARTLHQDGVNAAREGDLDTAHSKMDRALRVLEADFTDSTRFARATVMCGLGMVLMMRGQAASDPTERLAHFHNAQRTWYLALATTEDHKTADFHQRERDPSYPGLPRDDMRAIEIQSGVLHANMGYLDLETARMREAQQPGSGASDRRFAEISLWNAHHHFCEAGGNVADAVAVFAITAAQRAFIMTPPEQLTAEPLGA